MILSPIHVDNREQDPPPEIRVMELKALGHSALVTQLPVGDYSWTVDGDTEFIMERKSVQDFIASMPPDPRLSRFVQLTGGTSPNVGTVRSLLLEGKEIPSHSKWEDDSLDTILVALQALGIIVLRSRNAASSAKRIAQFYEWSGKEEHKLFLVPVLPQTRRNYSPGRHKAIRTVMGLEGFGEERAKNAVQSMGNAALVLEAVLAGDVARFKTIPDVGPVTVKKAHDQLWKQVYATS